MNVAQRKIFKLKIFDEEDITLDSNFPCGNLGTVELDPVNEKTILITSEPDQNYEGDKCSSRSWFNFRVKNVKIGERICFVIKDINILYSVACKRLMKYRPVYKIGEKGDWIKFSQPAEVMLDDDRVVNIHFEYCFELDNSEIPVYFAFCFPYSYESLQSDLERYKTIASGMGNSVYFHRDVLAKSTEGRNIDLLTISSSSGINSKMQEERLEGLFPISEEKRCQIFKKSKKIIFLTARVHPGETPASFGIQGVIEYLLNSSNQDAQRLRDLFVFKIIPMINPDGVERGHFRMDGHGVNLNRYYTNPCPEKQPSVFAIKKLLGYYGTHRIFFFCDFHAHGSPKSCFFYGNSLGFVMQVESRTFARMMSITCKDFSYGNCNFSKKQMGNSDNLKGRDKRSKEGSARVSTYRACHLVHSYTLEFGYHQNVQKSEDEEEEYYTIESFKDIGRCLLKCVLELLKKKSCSLIAKSEFQNVEGIRKDIAEKIRKSYKKKEANLLHKSNNIHDIIEKMYYKTIKEQLCVQDQQRLKAKNKSARKAKAESRKMSPKKKQDMPSLSRKKSNISVNKKHHNLYKINNHQKVKIKTKIQRLDQFEALKEPFIRTKQPSTSKAQVAKKTTEFKIDNLILEADLDTRHWSYGVIKRNIRKNPIRPKSKASQQFSHQLKRIKKLGEKIPGGSKRSPRTTILQIQSNEITETKRLMKIRSINDMENENSRSKDTEFTVVKQKKLQEEISKRRNRRRFPELIKVQSSLVMTKLERNSSKKVCQSKSINTSQNPKVFGFMSDSNSDFAFTSKENGHNIERKSKKRSSAKIRYSSLQVKKSKTSHVKKDSKDEREFLGNYRHEMRSSNPGDHYNPINFNMMENGGYVQTGRQNFEISNSISNREKLLQDKNNKILSKKRKRNFREISAGVHHSKTKKLIKKRSRNLDRNVWMGMDGTGQEEDVQTVVFHKRKKGNITIKLVPVKEV